MRKFTRFAGIVGALVMLMFAWKGFSEGTNELRCSDSRFVAASIRILLSSSRSSASCIFNSAPALDSGAYFRFMANSHQSHNRKSNRAPNHERE
jgi:hypothetical protein